MIVDPFNLANKKGILVVGSARSGSHYLCDILFLQSTIENKVYLGELSNSESCGVLEVLQKCENYFLYASLVQFTLKNLLLQYQSFFQNYFVINLRRRDKIAQYASWCLMRLSWDKSNSHTPTWNLIDKQLPFNTSKEDLEQFIVEQNFDYAWPADQIIYYEDLLKFKYPSNFKKNTHTKKYEEIFSDYNLVKQMLGNFSYYDK